VVNYSPSSADTPLRGVALGEAGFAHDDAGRCGDNASADRSTSMFSKIFGAKKAQKAGRGKAQDAAKDGDKDSGHRPDTMSELAKKNGKIVASAEAPGPGHSFRLPKGAVYKASPGYVPTVTKSSQSSNGEPEAVVPGALVGGEVDVTESRTLQLVLDQPFETIGDKHIRYEMGLSVDISRALNDKSVKPTSVSLHPGESMCSRSCCLPPAQNGT
jgi:hypothetical protein